MLGGVALAGATRFHVFGGFASGQLLRGLHWDMTALGASLAVIGVVLSRTDAANQAAFEVGQNLIEGNDQTLFGRSVVAVQMNLGFQARGFIPLGVAIPTGSQFLLVVLSTLGLTVDFNLGLEVASGS